MNKPKLLLYIAYIAAIFALCTKLLQQFISDFKTFKDFESDQKNEP